MTSYAEPPIDPPDERDFACLVCFDADPFCRACAPDYDPTEEEEIRHGR